MLHKSLPNSLKDVDTRSGVICGYASSFNVVDDGADMVLPGAFTKTLAEQGPASRQPRIKWLYQHDSTQILGVPQVLKEDGFGLYFEAKIADTTLGRDVLALYEAGVITEHSIGYETVEADWDRTQAVRLLKQLRLFEWSSVTWGMNADTPTIAVKSLSDPTRLSALATKAAALDSLLHSGNLRSDTLCATLERELKSLQTALDPTSLTQDAAHQPYTIRGVLDAMDDLTARLSAKAASDDDKAAQEARSKKYGIGVKDGGNVTKPGAWASLDDSDFGDPVNYRYPMPDKAHADNAAARFGAASARTQYSSKEQDIIAKRIMAKQKSFGEEPDWWPPSSDDGKGATMGTTRLVKATNGKTIEVSENGTHAAFTGTHTHSHKAMDSQGDDDMHEHSHTHEGDSDHGHTHGEKGAARHQHDHGHDLTHVRKARDFDTLFASLNASDQLQDDWGDTFIAFTHAMCELMWQSCAQNSGYVPEGSQPVDIEAAAKANLDAFSNAVQDLVTRSIAADFAPSLDYDGDQFVDPDGCNADEDGDYKRRMPLNMPQAPAILGKAGRSISNANRETITKALDGITTHIKGVMEHHAAIADLMTKTDPDRVRQDEDDAVGDSDTENGGHDVNKGVNKSATATMRRTATAGRTPQASTTHRERDMTTDTTTSETLGTLGTSALLADLDSVVHRLKSAAGKAQ